MNSQQQELYLYRLKADVQDKGVHHLVVVSSDEASAFDHAEKELERYTISTPEVTEWSIEEKKRLHLGSGFVICD